MALNSGECKERENGGKGMTTEFPFSLQIVFGLFIPRPEPGDCGVLQSCLLSKLAAAMLEAIV